ncbi:MAG: MMPL family transporter, partial [Candidatus Nanohaloarchaea archaeon]|nr:MMPL family transporter [Candidatus Nanohaloarchaea archaeon]
MHPFKALARIQYHHPAKILFMGLLVTAVLGAGIPKVQLQTDFQESLPDDLPPIKAKNIMEERFGSTESIIILFETKDSPKEPSYVSDIRDPRVIRSLSFLSEELNREPIVDSTRSIAGMFDAQPDSKQQVIQRLSRSRRGSLVNRDYTATIMFVTLSAEMTEENVREAVRVIRQNLDETPMYPGMKVRITGNPVIRNDISNVIVGDSVRTIALASLVILFLLVVARGRMYGPVTFMPLFIGLIWTLGFMGHVGIPLSFATIALGAMILGLGVEYGSFITERVVEEMEREGLEQGISTALPNTGSAIVGSALTDGIGFLALLLASFSFIRTLGISLALGELLTVTSALVMTPAMIVLFRRRY